MFAVEIDFRDGISPPETVLLRRSSAILGGSERSHLIIEGAGSHVPEIQIYRGPGRSFYTLPLSSNVSRQMYTSDADIAFGNYKLHITSLDSDLCFGKDELPDLTAVRVFRRALLTAARDFPALCLLGENPVCVSFYQETEIIVGRSAYCALRLDVPDISFEHSRFGYDDERFWVEDLGSTNGTIVNGEKISGRVFLESGVSVHIGASAVVIPVLTKTELSNLKNTISSTNTQQISYPCVFSNSNLVRPASFSMSTGVTISIGRDPASDIWINASHISREHLKLTLEDDGSITVIDCSSNGTFFDEKKLRPGTANRFNGPNSFELDLCSGVKLKLRFVEDKSLINTKKPPPFTDSISQESGLDHKSSANDKLNEENYIESIASDQVGADQLSQEELTDFEKYQRDQSARVNLAEIFEDEEEFNRLAARLELDRTLEAKSGEYRVAFFILVLVFLIASICVLIFTSDYFL